MPQENTTIININQLNIQSLNFLEDLNDQSEFNEMKKETFNYLKPMTRVKEQGRFSRNNQSLPVLKYTIRQQDRRTTMRIQDDKTLIDLDRQLDWAHETIKEQTDFLEVALLNYRHILVVDDTWFNIDALVEFLQDINENLVIDFAVNGKEAVEKLIQDKQEIGDHCEILVKTRPEYDAIFMDINMPVMDGVQAMQQIQRVFTHQVKIISVTAFQENYNSPADVQEQSEDLKFDGCIIKPITIDNLYEVIQKLSLKS